MCLDLLGRREPETYGHVTLEEVNATLCKVANKRGADLKTNGAAMPVCTSLSG